MQKWDARNVVAVDAHPSSLPNDKVSTSSCIQGSSISCYNACMPCQAPAKIPFQANTKNTLVFDLFVLVILSSFNSLFTRVLIDNQEPVWQIGQIVLPTTTMFDWHLATDVDSGWIGQIEMSHDTISSNDTISITSWIQCYISDR